MADFKSELLLAADIHFGISRPAARSCNGAGQVRTLEMSSSEVSPAEQGAVHLDPTQIEAREIPPG